MGWWSKAIMGGDEPLDDYGTFCDAAVPGKYTGSNDKVLTRTALNAALPEIRKRIAKDNKGYAHGRNIALQALGVTIMERGADLPDDLRAAIIHAAETDEWARVEDDAERRANEAAYIAKLKAYKPGTPVGCKREEGLLSRGGTSLFENMEKLVDEAARWRKKTGWVDPMTLPVVERKKLIRKLLKGGQ